MEYGKRLTGKSKNEKLEWEDSSFRGIADFLNKHYNIIIPMQDPDMMLITPKDETLWEYQPRDVLNEIYIHFKMEHINVKRNDILSVLQSPNLIKPFDPIKNYFDTIRGIYKGESHIDILCSCITPRVFDDNTPEYYRKRMNDLFKKWLVACVACWLDNIPNEVALTLISGEGGIGKTRLGQFLVPEKLKDYYISISKEDNRPFNLADAFTKYMFINSEEMVGITNATIRPWKQLMSQHEIATKASYERILSKKKRLACFIASTNHNQEHNGFIHPSWADERRFGCVEITDIDYNRYNAEVDIDQVWSEALNLYESTDFKHVFDKETDFPDFVNYNSRFILGSSALYYLRTHLTIPENDSDGKQMNASMVFDYLRRNKLIRREHEGPRHSDVNENTIGRALSSLGFKRVKFRPDGSSIPLDGYIVKFKDNQDKKQ